MRIVNIITAQSLSSTNKDINNYPANTLLIAQTQTNGQGRNGNTWVSPAGGLYMSYSFFDEFNYALGIYSFLASIAIHQILNTLTENKLYIKWPNDIYNVQGEKISGILLEKKSKKLILGIGVNIIDNPQLASKLDNYNYINHTQESYENLALKITQQYIKLLKNYKHNEIIEYYNKYCYLPVNSKALIYTSQNNTQDYITGTVMGLHEDFSLDILDTNNHIININSAYSIRPVI